MHRLFRVSTTILQTDCHGSLTVQKERTCKDIIAEGLFLQDRAAARGSFIPWLQSNSGGLLPSAPSLKW